MDQADYCSRHPQLATTPFVCEPVEETYLHHNMHNIHIRSPHVHKLFVDDTTLCHFL